MQFNVRFITPLLIHGSDPSKVDQVGLTGKALRGSWRFWFRALAGGIRSNIPAAELYKFESQVFGSADTEWGNTFRLLVEPVGTPIPAPITIQFSHSDVTFQGFKEGCEFVIEILPRKKFGDTELKVFLASIWLWGNLGAVGQRARRGFGSPVIVEKNDQPFSSLDLPIAKSFASSQDLENHLKKGLQQVWNIFSDALSVRGNPINGNPPPSKSPVHYFTLSSLDQIAIGGNRGSDVKLALQDVHGIRLHDKLGSSPERLASPLFLRLHMIGNNFYPVITWSEPNTDSANLITDWISKKLSFKQYISGKQL